MAETYFATHKAQATYKVKRFFGQFFLYFFLTVFALFLLTPFVFMIASAFMSPTSFEAFRETPNLDVLQFFSFDKETSKWVSYLGMGDDIATHWTLFNFKSILTGNISINGTAVEAAPFALYFLNTLIVAVGSTTVTVVTAVLAAFAFARLEFKGKDLLFALLLATMMIPGEMMVITNFQTVQALHWEFTFSALIFVHGVSVFYIYYLRQNFQQIPNELYLAAKVDGVGDIGYLFKVMVPIAMPTITTIIILSLMGAWNSYVWPMMVADGNWLSKGLYIPFTQVRIPLPFEIPKYNMQLVSNGLMGIFNNAARSASSGGGETIKIAGSMIVTAPLFVFFLIFRKYIMRGISRSGIKG